MKRWKYIPKAGLALCAAAWLAIGATFVWTDAGSGHNWATPANWNLNSGYPDGTDDNAVFPPNGGTPWLVTLIGEEIGTLTIEENLTTGFVFTVPTILTVNEFIIDASEGDVDVTISGPYIEINP